MLCHAMLCYAVLCYIRTYARTIATMTASTTSVTCGSALQVQKKKKKARQPFTGSRGIERVKIEESMWLNGKSNAGRFDTVNTVLGCKVTNETQGKIQLQRVTLGPAGLQRNAHLLSKPTAASGALVDSRFLFMSNYFFFKVAFCQ